MSKIKIHIRNNHWKKGFLPCDSEGEKNNTITKEEFDKRVNSSDVFVKGSLKALSYRLRSVEKKMQ